MRRKVMIGSILGIGFLIIAALRLLFGNGILS